MEECESQLSPTVYDVEEGEISDSASSVEEITEEAFNKKDKDQSSPVAVADSDAAPPPLPPKAISVNSPNNYPNNNNNTINNHDNNDTNQKPRVWTMKDLYKYQVYRNYSAGLHNIAWASAVHKKPLDEIFAIPKASSEDNGSNSNVMRAGSDTVSNKNNNNNVTDDNTTSIGDNKDGASAASPNVIDVDEKEEGELEEGEIDMDSEMVEADLSQENDFMVVDLDKHKQQLDLIRKGFELVSAEEAEKSFDEVSSRVQNLLDSMQEMAGKNILTTTDVLVQLAFTAIRIVNTVFCSMDRDKKESSKEILLRLLTRASSQKHPLFSAEHLKEIKVMICALDSSSEPLTSKDTNRNNGIQELEVVAKSDFDIATESVKNMPKKIVGIDSIPVESSDQPVPRMSLEYGKSGVSNYKYKGLSLPLLDLHKDHDADSLPSPTQGAPPCFPIEKGFAFGQGLLKPEWPVPRVAIERDNVPMHPYEIDAVKAVSSYQQKFGRSSLLMNERLPSPTPSEEGDVGDSDISGEVSSSSNMDVKPVGTSMVGQPTVSNAPKIDILTGQGLTDVQNAAPLSLGPKLSSKIASAKIRDPRLRLANSDVAALKHLLPVVNSEPKLEPVGGMISSRKQKTIEELVLDGPALKRQRNEQIDPRIVNNVQVVTGTGGWLEDRGTVGLGATNRSHALDSTGNDPRRPEYAATSVSSGSIMPSVTVNENENLPVTTPGATASLHSLLKDIAVNPTIWMNIIKMEQQKSADPNKSTTQPAISNFITGAVPSMNVVASKAPVLGQRAAVALQATPQSASGEELGKVRMKARDPRRVLHNSTLQKGGSMEFDQSQITSTSSIPGMLGNMNFQRQDDQLDKKGVASNSIAPPDITRQFTKNLKNIADIVSVSQATLSQPALPQISLSQPAVPQISPSQPALPQISPSQPALPQISPSQPALPQISPSQPAQACQGRTETVGTLELGKLQSGPGFASKEVSSGSSRPPNNWDDVEHLFEGFDDQQKAAIHRERARRMEEQRKMFAGRKLCLVLDLDHTLLNSAKFAEVDQMHDEILRKKEEQDREKPQRHLFRFPHMGMWTKLRPGVWNFLEKASKLYELHLYTMGNKLYATEMAKLLDPKGELFAGRVISRGDDGDLLDGDERVPKSKDLEGVMGMESAVVIIDDSLRVWPHNKLNLIVVERYIFFPCSRRQFGLPGPSLLEIDHDERSEDGTLASSLAVIERIHQMFFAHQSLDEADVRNILASEQKKILAGCRIVFSRVFPVGEANPHLHPLWQTAEQFGAVCTNSIDDQVTHVVANSLGTDKVNWALSAGRFVVHPGWVEASALLYRRASEKDFAIKQ
ncbi:hypothetical protein ACH5RR_030897 [Cinchona calisaya]|uniref:protein-serine/threonine phosphatase n=1 Tax=Cinchona calisaya TaxID=153742 RepID=A0ABD2YY47_9GENT